jgi:hypothetical protein
VSEGKVRMKWATSLPLRRLKGSNPAGTDKSRIWEFVICLIRRLR